MLDRLTFARFVAATVVVFYHFSNELLPGLAPTALGRVVLTGPSAVSFFYALSGFIMARVYPDLGPSDARRYWTARTARIYPVYLLAIAGGLTLSSPTTVDLALNLVALQAFVPGHALALNAPGWSISVEVFFYLLFPFVMPLCRHVGARFFAIAALSLWLLGQFWTVYLANYAYAAYPSPEHDFLYYFPLHHLPTFLVGIAAGTMAGSIRLRPASALACVLGALGAYAAANLVLPDLAARSSLMLPLPAGFFAPVFAVLCLGLFHLPSRWCTSGAAIFAGEASYSLYLLQLPVMLTVAPSLRGIGMPAWAAAWLALGVLLVLAALVFRFVETPLRNVIRRPAAAERLPEARVA